MTENAPELPEQEPGQAPEPMPGLAMPPNLAAARERQDKTRAAVDALREARRRRAHF